MGRNLALYQFKAHTMKNLPTSNIQKLREEARKNLDLGAVITGDRAQRQNLIEQLNEALATELVCVLRYRRHYFMARGIHSRSVASEFLAHSNEELGHADKIAARIVQLGGEPDFAPSTLGDRSHAEYIAGTTLVGMIRENLVAERIAIQSYRNLIDGLGTQDPTTSDLLKLILAKEEEHADELADLLTDLPQVESTLS